MEVIQGFGIEDPVVERGLVSALILNPSKVSIIVPHLPSRAFVEDDCRSVYIGIQELYGKGIVLEQIALSNELLRVGLYDEVGGSKGVEKFFRTVTNADPGVLFRIVLDMHSRRLEIDLADKIQARANDRSDENDMAVRLALIQQELQGLQVLGLDDTLSLTSDEFTDYYDNLLASRQRNRGVEQKLVFKSDDLNLLSPSLVAGDFIVLVAESGAGKTSWMADQAEFWWKSGAHGVFYHLELGLQKMADRRMARNTGISSRRLQDGRGISQELPDGWLLEEYSFLDEAEYALVKKALIEFSTWPGSLTLKHCPGWTMAQITADMRQRASAGPFDFAVLDYWNKVRTVSRHRGSYVTFDQAQDVELFKSTCESEEVACIGLMAAQFGKGEAGKIRTVANALGTSELEHKGNIGFFLDRPRDEETGQRVPCATMYMTKCNAGREGKALLYFDGGRYRFLPATEETVKF